MNQLPNQLPDRYIDNMNTLVILINNNKYLFEMTKCCGYGFILPIYKMHTLNEFYHIMDLELSHLTITRIYLENLNGEQIEFPRNEMTMYDFINENNAWFTPIYPLPSKVVYKVFFDDGHHHNHDNHDNTVNIVNNNI